MTQNHQRGVSKPLKILHIAFTMHARGTETWLMNVLRRIDKNRFQFDFLTVEGEKGIYDQEILDLGGKLHACPHPGNKGAFLRGLRKILQEKGPFDVIHAHPYTLSGLALMQGARAGIPVRIVHSHTDRRKARRDKSVIRRAYIGAMKKLISRTATYGLAASDDAAVSLFGKNWNKDPRWNIMHCGIDLEPFKKTKTKEAMRKSLGIPQQAHVMGHVGSFHFEKNHEFLLHLFEKMAKSDLKLHLILVGDGPLKQKYEDRVKTLNLEKRVIFTGVRSDVPDLLKAMDIFVFPSLFEGLGLAVVEAQAAGLPCLVADTVPQEASIVDGAVEFLPLENADEQWVKAIKEKFEGNRIDAARALNQVSSTPFNIDHNVTMLMELYDTLSGRQDSKDAA
tara:strand:- start:674 stop:1855 length:1182 start_codon:yes stop_codon:yes gene_type:complete